MRENLTKAAKSRMRRGLPKANTLGLPYGAGSIQIRGRVYWMMYRSVEGTLIQENAQTDDAALARLKLAERALVTERAKVAALETIFHEAEKAGFAPTAQGWERTAAAGRSETDDSGKRRTGGGSVPPDAAQRGDSRKTARGGKRQ